MAIEWSPVTEVDGVDEGREQRRREAISALTHTPTEELVASRAQLQAAAHDAGLSSEEIQAVLNARPELPRPLLPSERETLLAILGHADFEGRDELVAQVDSTAVSAYWGCGCASVNFQVEPGAPRALSTPSPIPNEALILDADGESIGGIIVFLDDGYLSCIDVHDWLDDAHGISPLPPLDRLVLVEPSDRKGGVYRPSS